MNEQLAEQLKIGAMSADGKWLCISTDPKDTFHWAAARSSEVVDDPYTIKGKGWQTGDATAVKKLRDVFLKCTHVKLLAAKGLVEKFFENHTGLVLVGLPFEDKANYLNVKTGDVRRLHAAYPEVYFPARVYQFRP